MKNAFEVKTEPTYAASMAVASIIGTCSVAVAVEDNITVDIAATTIMVCLALGIKTLKYKWGGKNKRHQKDKNSVKQERALKLTETRATLGGHP